MANLTTTNPPSPPPPRPTPATPTTTAAPTAPATPAAPRSDESPDPRPNAATKATPATNETPDPHPNAATKANPATNETPDPRPSAATKAAPAAGEVISVRPNASTAAAMASTGTPSPALTSAAAAGNRTPRPNPNPSTAAATTGNRTPQPNPNPPTAAATTGNGTPRPNPEAVTTIGDGGPVRPVRVAVVDDDPLVRSGLRLLFASAPDLEVVAEGADGADVPALVDAHHPDVVLLDVRMPRVDGLAAAERLCARPRRPHVVMLTTFHADAYVLRALRAGASGYLLKDAPPRELVEAVRRVAAGEPILSPAVTRRLIEQVSDPVGHDRRVAATALLDRATDREREVASAVARGLSNAQIGTELGMGTPTVKAHVSRLLTKLGLDNRVQLALLVHDAGPGTPPER